MKTARLLMLSSSFTPLKLFGASDLGAWYDPKDWDSMRQATIDATAAASGSPVGIVFDKRYGYARGSNLFTNAENGTFATGVGSIAMTYDASIAWHEAVPSIEVTVTAGAPPSGVALQAFDTVVGRDYEITATLMAPSANTAANAATLSCNPSGGTAAEGVQADAEDAWQTKTFYFRATVTSTVLYGWVLNRGIAWGAAGDKAYFTNISIKEVSGSHAIQTTADNRPTLAAGGKIDYDGVNDELVTTWPSSLGSACTVARSVPQGEATILTGQTITTTYTDSTDHCGLVIINRALTATETNQLRRWLNRRAG